MPESRPWKPRFPSFLDRPYLPTLPALAAVNAPLHPSRRPSPRRRFCLTLGVLLIHSRTSPQNPPSHRRVTLYSSAGSAFAQVASHLLDVMPSFFRAFSNSNVNEKKDRPTSQRALPQSPTAQRPTWQDAWLRTEVAPEEVQELLHVCTQEMKSRGEPVALGTILRTTLTWRSTRYTVPSAAFSSPCRAECRQNFHQVILSLRPGLEREAHAGTLL